MKTFRSTDNRLWHDLCFTYDLLFCNINRLIQGHNIMISIHSGLRARFLAFLINFALLI